MLIHGMNADATTWNGIDGQLGVKDKLNQLYSGINARSFTYNESAGFGTSAGEAWNNLQTGSIVVAHSMGGLIARSVVSSHGTERVGALITIGTPHAGSRLAYNLRVNPNGVNNMITQWVYDLSQPWFLYSNLNGWTQDALYASFMVLLDEFGNMNQYNSSSLEALDSENSYIATTDASSKFTFPAAKVAIVGREYNSTFTRLTDAKMNDGFETGDGVIIQYNLQDIYFIYYMQNEMIAQTYMAEFWETGDWEAYLKGQEYYNISDAFLNGFLSLGVYMQDEWATAMGAKEVYNSPYGNYFGGIGDGIVNAYTQAPLEIFDTEETLFADGATHLEETKIDLGLSAGYRTISQSFDKIKEALELPQIDVDGGNLISSGLIGNGCFQQTGFQSWSTTSPAPNIKTIVSSTKKYGNYSYHHLGDELHKGIYQVFDVQPNFTYKISGSIYAVSHTDIRLEAYNPLDPSGYPSVMPTSTGVWEDLSFTTTTASGQTKLLIFIGGNGEAYFDGIRVDKNQ